jgi:hypothetical protein
MAPALNLRFNVADLGHYRPAAGAAARMNRAAGRHGHFAPKSAPQHRDFGAGKVGLI